MTEREHDKLTLSEAIGAILQHLRNRTGLSLRDLADEAKYGHTNIHRAETGAQLPSDSLMGILDKRYDMGGTLVNLLEAVRGGSIQEYGKKAAAREAKAERIQVATSSTIPSLLQTPDYARALYRAQHPKAPSKYVDQLATDRMKRKEVFNREEAPDYWAIMDESALRRPIGGKATMADQLAHVLTFAEKQDFTIQVLPFERGEYWMLGGSLTLLTGANGSTIAYVESFGSGELVEATKRVIELTKQFDLTRSLAMPETESLDLVRNYMEEYRG